MELSLALTTTEQFASIYGIKRLTTPERMTFLARPRRIINYRVIPQGSPLFSSFSIFPTLNPATPSPNALISWLPSAPTQAAQTLPKIGSSMNTIEGSSQPFLRGLLPIISQRKESPHPYSPLSDCMIGPIPHSTTGLHGPHVSSGSFGSSPIISGSPLAAPESIVPNVNRAAPTEKA